MLLDRLDRISKLHCEGAEPAHDYLHVKRVAGNARRIAVAEGADVTVVIAAALLHELFNHPKDHPESHRSGDVCAEVAAKVLAGEGCEQAFVEQVAYAIRVHPFSRGIHPETLEAKILQDADRLDAIGAIGIARCFATCATMKRPFYRQEDPFCERRTPDDKAWGADHFYRKLLGLAATMHTASARALAEQRTGFMRGYLAELGREIGAE